MKKKAYIILIFLVVICQCILPPYRVWCQEDGIVISIINNVDLGEIIQGFSKNSFIDEQVIIFEINCNCNDNIRITKISDLSHPDFEIDAEWKAGPVTGFENFFEDGIFTPENEKYYVTLTIKSVRVKSWAEAGSHIFSPAIGVEFCNI